MGNLYIARTLTDDYVDDKASESHGSDLVRSSKQTELQLFVCLLCLRNGGGNCCWVFFDKMVVKLRRNITHAF